MIRILTKILDFLNNLLFVGNASILGLLIGYNLSCLTTGNPTTLLPLVLVAAGLYANVALLRRAQVIS